MTHEPLQSAAHIAVPTDVVRSDAPAAPPAPPPPAEVPVAHVVRDPDQPRRTFDEDRLRSLVLSIRRSGVIQPLVVRPHPDAAARATSPYMLLAGERRWLAAQRAGLSRVPVHLRTAGLSDSDRLMLQIAENDADLAENLTLWDLANAVARAYRLSGLTQAAFAHRHHRSQSWVSQLLALANSTGLLRDALEEGYIRSLLTARTYIRLPPFRQRTLLTEARADQAPLSLSRIERAANHLALRRTQRQAIDARRLAEDPTETATDDPTAPTEPPALAPTPPEEAALLNRTPPDATGDSTALLSFPAAPPAGLSAPHIRALPMTGAPSILRRGRQTTVGDSFTIAFTPQQLETVLILLGIEPADDIPDQIGQLFACL